MSAQHPIPAAALDDRLGFVGTAGSGKTYNASGCVEQLLRRGARCIILDPLDVWFGLRLLADGKTESPFKVVIFGGEHGDLPLNEHAGALIGETVAGMAESCIVSLSTLGTNASERRFMLAFLTAIYRKASREPVHLIFDEADLWAPQRLLDKEGEAAKLLGQMETIVRRGRRLGFIPWLITQRPAVLSKNVLSQIDGLVAFKLTSTQDRDAIGDWVEGQADKAEWKRLYGQLAAFQRGHGLVWIPGRGFLKDEDFPAKATFDSSATPKRGERKHAADLKPLNVEALKSKLETVSKEAVENDPRRLKGKIAELERALKQGAAQPSAQAQEDVAKLKTSLQAALQSTKEDLAKARAWGHAEGEAAGLRKAAKHIAPLLSGLSRLGESMAGLKELLAELKDPKLGEPNAEAFASLRIFNEALSKSGVGPTPSRGLSIGRTDPIGVRRVQPPRPAPTPRGDGAGEPLGKGERAILIAVAQHPDGVTREQLTVLTGYKRSSRDTYLQRLGANGYVEIRDRIVATNGGIVALGPDYEPLPTGDALREYWLGRLPEGERRVLEAVIGYWPEPADRDAITEATGYKRSSRDTYLQRLGARELVTTDRGTVRAVDELFN